MTTDTDQESLEGTENALLDGEVTEGDQLEQTALSAGSTRDFEYKLLAFIPRLPWKQRDPVPEKAAHLIIPDITKARIYRIVSVQQTTFIPKVSPAYNRLFLNVNSKNWPNPTPLQDAIWASAITQWTSEDGRARTQQIYLVPCISLYNDPPEPVIVEMTVNAYNAIIDENEKADSYTKGKTNLRTCAIFAWRVAGEEKKGEARAEFDAETNIAPYLEEFAGSMPDVAEYVKMRAKATEEYFKSMYSINSIGHKDLEVEPQDRETEYADMVPSLEPDQLKALFKRHGIKYPLRANKMALIDIALGNSEALFDSVKEMAENTPPF